MSSFWNMSFKFELPTGEKFEEFSVEPLNTATSEKNNTVKINGLINLNELTILTEWFHKFETVESWNAFNPNPFKIEAITSNGKVLGCFPISMSFNTIFKRNIKPKDIEQGRLWKAHIVLSYDKLNIL